MAKNLHCGAHSAVFVAVFGPKCSALGAVFGAYGVFLGGLRVVFWPLNEDPVGLLGGFLVKRLRGLHFDQKPPQRHRPSVRPERDLPKTTPGLLGNPLG